MPKLLLVSPYAPGGMHLHAASDVIDPLTDSLAKRFDLHVAAPSSAPAFEASSTFHPLTPPSFRLSDRFGSVPAAVRFDWPKRANSEVRDLIDSLRPDYVHFEYLQATDAAIALAQPWTCTLHDIAEIVFKQREPKSIIDRSYRTAEWLRVTRMERRAIRTANRTFTLSPKDALHVNALGGRAEVLQLGVPRSTLAWRPSSTDAPSIVFAGAMWRDANRAAAEWLVLEVMPLVWASKPATVLRLVGAGSENIADLSTDARIEITGPVPSFEEEFLKASAVLAPSVVDAGILLKALKGMAVGAPVVLSTKSAAPFARFSKHLSVGSDAVHFSAEVLTLLEDPTHASSVGQTGRNLVEREFSWDAYAEKMPATITSIS